MLGHAMSVPAGSISSAYICSASFGDFIGLARAVSAPATQILCNSGTPSGFAASGESSLLRPSWRN